MKSSGGKEGVEINQRYVFLSNPESIVEEVERSVPIHDQRFLQSKAKQIVSRPSLDNLTDSEATKSSRSFLALQTVQPYPFTFITAVKRKLALAAYNETTKKVYNTHAKTINPTSINQSLYQAVQNMDFVKPLKIPDVKISPKTLDGQNTREATPLKFATSCGKGEKTPKNMERAHRKLDFSLSEGHSLISSDDIEPLKAPDLSISPSIAKKKEHMRDSSREKENRTKRIKKDDGIIQKSEDMSQRLKNSKHVSRKDVTESKRLKNDRTFSHLSKEIEFTSKKPKSKNFATSTVKKDDVRQQVRSSSIHSTKTSSRDRSLESRGRTFSSESLSDRNIKAHEKVTVRDCSRGTDSDASALKYNDDYEILNALRQLEEQKHKSIIDSRPSKILPRSSQSTVQEQHKRNSERTKPSTSKSQGRSGSSTSEIPEELETVSDSSNKNRSAYTEISQQSKSKDPSNSQSNPNNESQNITEISSEEVLLDPIRISFRDDSYSQQDEFCDLVTPEINLTLRSKRRKQVVAENESDPELKTPKHRPPRNTENTPTTSAPMLHPTALHMQFQAELHLFDSYNESLRQVMDVEKCLYNVKHEKGKELLQKQRLANEEMKKQLTAMQAERDTVEAACEESPVFDGSPGKDQEAVEKLDANVFASPATNSPDLQEKVASEVRKHIGRHKSDGKDGKPDVKVAEVQTQTANDIATQTDTRVARQHNVTERLKQYPGITYDRGGFTSCELPEISLGSLEQFEGLDHIEDISLPSRMRTMSEISLHETTSSIKTETGTEISISTRDVTCSFNKYLDLEMAQLIKDEKQMYDKIEMLFKSREKTLNDRTRKLVKLEEQKRALRDTGQDSRISSVKKKQRALLLKLQQEKDEMNRLKELHKMASQERKLMLQKQRNMFNPQMSTKNILTKLKRSADCQSPRRLSGPMKGYDIRSNSSMSSLVDSDKSQVDRSHIDLKLQLSDNSLRLEGKSHRSEHDNSAPEKPDASNNKRHMSVLEESANSLNNLDQLNAFVTGFVTPQKLESKTRKFEEKMPCSKTHNHLVRSKHAVSPSYGQIPELHEVSAKAASRDVDNLENAKSESDTLVEEFSKKSKPQSLDAQAAPTQQEKETENSEMIQGEADSINSRKSKASQVNEESLLNNYKGSKKSEKSVVADRDATKKSQQSHDSKAANKRKGTKSVKAKSASNILTENILRSKGNSYAGDEITKPANKRTRTDKESMIPEDNYQNSILEELDLNDSQNSLQALVKHSRAVKDKNYKLLRDIADEHETKENILSRNALERSSENRDNNDGDIHNLGNISTRSQVSTFTISRHSSGDSEKSFSRSVVIRAQDHRFKTSKKLEQVLNAREAALTTRRNCVEDWIAWHTKLKAEESRVARMEQAAFKLVSTTANALPYHDTTMSSDTSDVEVRVELLAEKLAERRVEMSKLKREARRQAKQRLKALEANLLNQIKKYDTTIHEMRKKLETQKTIVKDSDKLAIESRSVADFKVPEIPIKRIQEIYKSGDLLRSRSESDLIFSNITRNDVDRSVNAIDQDNESVCKSSSSPDNKSSKLSKLSSPRALRKNQSAESVLEDAKNFVYSNSERNSEVSSDKESRAQDRISAEDSEGSRISGIDAPETIITDPTKSKNAEIPEFGEISEAMQTPETNESSKLFSRKLVSLQLTNKNLNDDISSLENDLKALSEMMSHFSKKSDEKVKLDSSVVTEHDDIVTVAKSISKDISDDLSKSIHSEVFEEISSVPEDLEEIVSVEFAGSIPEQSNVEQDIEKSDGSEEMEAEVTEVISTIMPDVESSVSKPSEEIDYEARSKEILNVIEQSIISEHVKSPGTESNMSEASLEKSMKDMHEHNEVMSQDLNSLEDDMQSISKIVESREETFDMPLLRVETQELASNDHKSQEEIIESEKELEELLSIVEIEDKSSRESPNEESSPDTNGVDQPLIESPKSLAMYDEEPESVTEELSGSHQEDYLYNESSAISRKSSEASSQEEEEQADPNDSSLETSINENNEEFKEPDVISIGKVSPDNDWTISDSFQAPNRADEIIESAQWEQSVLPDASITIEPSDFSAVNVNDETKTHENNRENQNFTCDMEDVSMFIPKGESTTIGYKYEDSLIDGTKSESMHTDELDDILDIIARESKQTEESHREQTPEITSPAEQPTSIPQVAISNRLIPLPTDLNLTAEVEPVLQKLTEILQGVERNIARRRRSGNDSGENREDSKEPTTVSSEPTSVSVHTSKGFSVATEESEAQFQIPESPSDEIVENLDGKLQEDSPAPVTEIEDIVATEIDTDVEKIHEVSGSAEQSPKISESPKIAEVESEEILKKSESVGKLVEKTFEILRDPEYEDISEESLEVSEILDKTESQRSSGSSKAKLPEKYVMPQKSDEVLRILDEISQQSYMGLTKQDEHLHDIQISVQVFGSVSPGFAGRKDSPTNGDVAETREICTFEDHINRLTDKFTGQDELTERNDEKEKYSRGPNEQQEESESSEGADTPRGVSEIELDSPRDANESRLDIDALDDDLLSVNESARLENDAKIDFHVTPVIATSEKDIEAMIDKLKASLEQPGLEVAELEAKLLRIEQLQIELEIKKLEAEEVSFYVREIPNKPPPPYTPPGGGRLSTPQVSPTLPPAVVPSNVEELTAFTEKATVLIFNAKNSGEDIMSLQPPPEICELSKDNNEIAKQDRRIYNTFLFDLCKETIAELYRCEYENPGPSWTKPNVQTKPAIKIPKTVEELNEYVSKEVATLFGFKTKLQRENMVMRWSRKRRDRVDELLAREAQAEEDEWTKFHHDELAVKNELTIAILDTLLLETTNVVKAVYAKKQKIMA